MRVLMLVSDEGDAELCRETLRQLNVPWLACEDSAQLAREIDPEAGAILLAEETLGEETLAALRDQPSWSDLQLVVLVPRDRGTAGRRRAEQLPGNVLLVESPADGAVLRSALRTALRARERQYVLRDRLQPDPRREQPPRTGEEDVRADDARRIRAEQALARSRAEFEAIFNSLSEAVVIADPGRRIVMVNPAFTAVFGYTAEEALGRTTEFLYADKSEFEAQGRLRYGENTPPPREVYEVRYRRKDGTVFLAESVGDHIRDEQGRQVGFVSLQRDVTERKRAEDLLRRREYDYRTLAENLPGMVYRVYLRENRRMHFFNDSVEEMTGYTLDGLTPGDACSIDPLIEPEDRRRVIDVVNRAIRERVPFDVAYRIRCKDGEVRHFSERGRPICDDDGEPLYIDGVIFDVTEREHAEQALRESEQQFRQVAEHIEEVFFLITPDWNEVLYISPAYEEVWGRSCGSLYESPRSWIEAVFEEDRPVAVTAMKEGIAGRLPQSFPEYRILRPDGTQRWIKARGWPILDEGGRVYRVAGIAEDVTERKRAEESLRQSHGELHAIYDSMHDGLLVVDMETRRFIRTNSSMCRILGYTESELLSTSVPDIHPPEAMPIVEGQIRALWDKAPQFFENVPVVAKDGTRRWMDISGTREVYNGRPCAIAYFHDITERIEMEQTLERAKEAAEAANLAKSRFLANTSHELRTPMSAILGMTDLALDEELSPTVRDYLETARDAASTLLDLINDLLDFSRIEAGRFELESTPFRLRQTVAQVVKTLGVRAYEKGLELICDWPGEAPDRVVGDPLRLRQILVNLVGNAIKFTPAGEVVVAMEVASHEENEIVVGFSVADTGIGIAPENQQRIFEPFLQADASSTRDYGGSGLGLAITVALVERMGGRLGVQSRLGQGATFDFTVRLGLQSQDDEEREAETPGVPPAAFGDVPVLVVAESAAARRVVERMLAGWGMRPESAADGESALARLRAASDAGSPFRLVLAECHSPHIDGLSLARSVRGESKLAEAIILMGTASDCRVDPANGKESAAVLLEKPVLSSNLMRAVAEALGVADGLARLPAARFSSTPAERSLQVLLAEDSPAVQKFVERLLGRRGHQVHVAGDGRRALEMVGGYDFDVVLMDLQMPRMDGVEATTAIRALAEPAKARLPIVALTAHALKGEAERCLAAGMDAYVSKPVDSQQLIDLVEELAGAAPAALDPRPRLRGVFRRKPRAAEQAALPAESPREASAGIFDFDDALGKCLGEYEMLQKMIQSFFDEAAPLLDAMRCALSERDAPQLAGHAHRLKNTVLFLAARPAIDATRLVEQIARSGDLAEAQNALDNLAEQIGLLADAIVCHRRTKEPPSDRPRAD